MTKKNSECKGYYLSDVKGIGRFPYYDGEEISRNLWHDEIKCTEKTDGDLCKKCVLREEKLKTYVYPTNVLKVSLNGKSASHHNIFHRRIGEPIPPWSHAAGGIWDKEMEKKGYSKEMVKFVVDEKKLYALIATLKGKKDEKVEAIMKEFPISKTRAGKYITEYNNHGLPPSTPSLPIPLPPIIVSREKEEAFDIVEIHLKKLELGGKSYLYEPNKSKVYTIDYDYVGRYDSKEKRICQEYPDSDAEPTLN